MEVRYRRERNNSFLIILEDDPGDVYTTRMLTENQISGVLALSVKQIDRQTAYYFEISGRQSLQKLLEKRQITAEELRRLFYGIERSLLALEEHLLEVEKLLLEPEFLYVLPDFSQVFLCCHPGASGDFFAGLRLLSQYLLNKIDHLNQNSVELAYEIFRITCEDDFTFQDILDALEGENAVPEPLEAPAETRERELPADVLPEPPQSVWTEAETDLLPAQLREPEKKPFWSILVPVGGFLLVGIFYVLGGLDELSGIAQGGVLLLAAALLILAGWRLRHREQRQERRESGQPKQWETIPCQSAHIEKFRETLSVNPLNPLNPSPPVDGTSLLVPSRRPLAHPRRLISQNLLRHESITCEYMPFVLGKLTGTCDQVIPQAVISRIHARLEQKEDGIYLTDLNSTNGTFQNGTRLIPNRPYRLRSGDEVTLADLKYIFQ